MSRKGPAQTPDRLSIQDVEILPGIRGEHPIQKHIEKLNIKQVREVVVNDKKLDKTGLAGILSAVSKKNKNVPITYGHLEECLKNSHRYKMNISSTDKQRLLKWAKELATKNAPRQMNRQPLRSQMQFAKGTAYSNAFGIHRGNSLGERPGYGKEVAGAGSALRQPNRNVDVLGANRYSPLSKPAGNMGSGRFVDGLSRPSGSSGFGGNLGKK